MQIKKFMKLSFLKFRPVERVQQQRGRGHRRHDDLLRRRRQARVDRAVRLNRKRPNSGSGLERAELPANFELCENSRNNQPKRNHSKSSSLNSKQTQADKVHKQSFCVPRKQVRANAHNNKKNSLTRNKKKVCKRNCEKLFVFLMLNVSCENINPFLLAYIHTYVVWSVFRLKSGADEKNEENENRQFVRSLVFQLPG
jgi:hypothetical protein